MSNLPLMLAAPASSGSYWLIYDLVNEGITWFNWRGAATVSLSMTVTGAGRRRPQHPAPARRLRPRQPPRSRLRPRPRRHQHRPLRPHRLPRRPARRPATPALSPTATPAASVTINPGDNIQAAVNANPRGTTFRLKAGTHRMTAELAPKDGDSFVGDPGAIVSGAKIWIWAACLATSAVWRCGSTRMAVKRHVGDRRQRLVKGVSLECGPLQPPSRCAGSAPRTWS